MQMYTISMYIIYCFANIFKNNFIFMIYEYFVDFSNN